jgi:hypothetical protein
MPPKKEKQVDFDPTVEIYQFVKNVLLNVTEGTGDRERKEAAVQIHRAFATYLGQVEQNFPTIVYDEKNPKIVKDTDIRITAYYVLMQHLLKSEAQLPERYKKKTLGFHVSGWPVAAEDNSFEQWGIFTRAAAAAFQKVFPNADLTAWAVPNPVDSNSNTQDEHESPTDASLIASGSGLQDSTSSSCSSSASSQDEIELHAYASLLADELDSPEQQQEPQQESMSPDFIPSNPQAEAKLVPQERENYDFNAWQAPEKLKPLLASIKAMHTYGLRLKSACPEKAEAAMQLAIELTEDLKNYHETSPEVQNKEVFKTDFHYKLHSQDDLMSTHRHYSKVVLANIAIALTGIGLAALVVSLLVRGHGFYNSTQGQNKVNDIDQQFDKSLRVT